MMGTTSAGSISAWTVDGSDPKNSLPSSHPPLIWKGMCVFQLAHGRTTQATWVKAAPSPTIGVDTLPPPAPQLSFTDTGRSSADGITNNGVVTVTGIEDNAAWQYSVDGGKKWLTGSNNQFTLAEGDHVRGAIQVRQQDRAGNLSAINQSVKDWLIDKTQPSLLLNTVGGDDVINLQERSMTGF
jgi:hypothetical protein